MSAYKPTAHVRRSAIALATAKYPDAEYDWRSDPWVDHCLLMAIVRSYTNIHDAQSWLSAARRELRHSMPHVVAANTTGA